MKKTKKILWCESQSGFDGRVLINKPHLAQMLRQAGFRYPRIAWDGSLEKYDDIEKQIYILVGAGYNPKDIYIFMLYNWEIPFIDMEKKRIRCWNWKVQIADCRYRPLDLTHECYNPKESQTDHDYHIHYNWTDAQIKQFRKNVRRQNICVRQRTAFYSKSFERKIASKDTIIDTKRIRNRTKIIEHLEQTGVDYWFPEKIAHPQEQILLPESEQINALVSDNTIYVAQKHERLC